MKSNDELRIQLSKTVPCQAGVHEPIPPFPSAHILETIIYYATDVEMEDVPALCEKLQKVYLEAGAIKVIPPQTWREKLTYNETSEQFDKMRVSPKIQMREKLVNGIFKLSNNPPKHLNPKTKETNKKTLKNFKTEEMVKESVQQKICYQHLIKKCWTDFEHSDLLGTYAMDLHCSPMDALAITEGNLNQLNNPLMKKSSLLKKLIVKIQGISDCFCYV